MSTSALHTMLVPLSQILDLLRDRKDRTTKKYYDHETAMMLDIKAVGIRNALKVFQVNNGYQLVCGQTRLNAARRAGLADAPVIVLQGSMTPTRLLIEELADNNMTEGFDTLAQAEIYTDLMKENGWTKQCELCANVPVAKPAAVSKALSIFENLVDELKSKLRAGEIGPRLAYALSRIDPARQPAEFEKVKGMKVEAAENYLGELAGGKPKAKPALVIKIRTPNGIDVVIPHDIGFEAALADLALPAEAIRRAQKHALPLTSLPQLLQRTPPQSNAP